MAEGFSLTKYDITPSEDWENLPRIKGYIVQRGRFPETEYTALWSEDDESNYPCHVWFGNMSDDFIEGFIEGVRDGTKSGYKRGRDQGIRLVQNGFAMVFGTVGRSYVQQILNEMDQDERDRGGY